MKLTNIAIIFLLIVFNSFAQKLRTPAEILKIMEKSPFSYEMNVMTKTIDCKNESGNVLEYVLHYTVTDSGTSAVPYIIPAKIKLEYDKAENYFNNGELDSALVYYREVDKAEPGMSLIHTFIGQVLDKKKMIDEAVEEYKKAISLNRIDYMAHWFLADLYFDQGKPDEAVIEITRALILNRNNPGIIGSLKKIFKAAKRDWALWCFAPQVEISQTGVNQAKISATSEWMGYGLAKAAWEFEPDFKKPMADKAGNQSIKQRLMEEIECLYCEYAILSDPSTDVSSNEPLKVLKSSFKNNAEESYIWFEILSREDPYSVYSLSEKRLDDIKNYVLTIRNKPLK